MLPPEHVSELVGSADRAHHYVRELDVRLVCPTAEAPCAARPRGTVIEHPPVDDDVDTVGTSQPLHGVDEWGVRWVRNRGFHQHQAELDCPVAGAEAREVHLLRAAAVASAISSTASAASMRGSLVRGGLTGLNGSSSAGASTAAARSTCPAGRTRAASLGSDARSLYHYRLAVLGHIEQA